MSQNNQIQKIRLQIESLLNQSKYDEAYELCDLLFEYKPVLLKAINTKAKVLYSLERFQEVIQLYQANNPPFLAKAVQFELIKEDEIEAYELIYMAREKIPSEAYLVERSKNFVYMAKNYVDDNNAAFLLKNQFTCLNKKETNEDIYKLEVKALTELAILYFNLSKDMECLLTYSMVLKIEGATNYETILEWIEAAGEGGKPLKYILDNLLNCTLILRQLLEFDYPMIFMKESEYDTSRAELFAMLFVRLNKEIWLIDSPVVAEVSEYNISEINEITLQNIQVVNGINIVTPIAIMKGEVNIDSNINFVLQAILGMSPKNYCILIGADHYCHELLERKNLNKELHLLAVPYAYNLLKENAAIGYIGCYLEFLGQLFGTDTVSNLDKEAETKISIVIPCKDNAKTLRYTLKTCLEQSIEKTDYEIVISDNSEQGNTTIHELVIEMNDERIKYYKTPRYLPLNRSFEYGFLKAKGEFIFAIGGDDAVTFHGLETLSRILDRFPDEDLVHWQKGFYIWPEFAIKGQAGQFGIPALKNEISARYFDCMELRSGLKNGKVSIYLLPMLYINSGCKKKYLKKMLKYTGGILDGNSQDVNTGVINLALNDKFLSVDQVITLAGMSSSSMGLLSTLTTNHKENFNYLGNGYPIILNEDKLMMGSDKVTFMNAYKKIQRLGVNDKLNDLIEWRTFLVSLFAEVDIFQEAWDFSIKSILNFAANNNMELYQDLEKSLFSGLDVRRFSLKDLENIERIKEKQTYQEEYRESGERTLDSRKYKINNIYEACQFVESLRSEWKF